MRRHVPEEASASRRNLQEEKGSDRCDGTTNRSKSGIGWKTYVGHWILGNRSLGLYQAKACIGPTSCLYKILGHATAAHVPGMWPSHNLLRRARPAQAH